jgi:hypothetical protein
LTPRILASRRQKAFRPGWLQQQLTTTVRYRSLLDSTSLPGNTKITMAVISLMLPWDYDNTVGNHLSRRDSVSFI